MARFPQEKGQKGSQKWIQYFVNQDAGTLNDAIGYESIDWYSPLKSDDYAEYRDRAFTNKLDIELDKVRLKDFWHKNGPQWDALGRADTGDIILVEAKSHIDEVFTSSTAKEPKSIELIEKSLREVSRALNAKPGLDWMSRFYQYGNRLAHAYFLNELNDIPTKLIFVNFINDLNMDGPKNIDEWQAAMMVVHEAMGIKGKIPDYVKHVYLDVNNISSNSIKI